jgi:hypothetical protein
MIVTNLKKYSNFVICYGSLRKGDVIYHLNTKYEGIHSYFYGIRGHGYVYCPDDDEKVEPEVLSRYKENITRFANKKLEYHALSESNLDYLMFIKRENIDIIELTDMWMETGDSKVLHISKDESVICFEGEAELVHNNGSKVIKNLLGITSSQDQYITIRSLDNAKIVKVKCRRN